MNTCKLQPRFRLRTHAVLDRTQLGADAAVTQIKPTLSPLAAGLFSTDNYFLDSFHRYLRPSAFKSLCFSSFSLSLSLSLAFSLPFVSFVLQTEQWYCLSEAHLFPCPSWLSGWICHDSGHTWFTGGHAHADTHGHLVLSANTHAQSWTLCKQSKWT